MAGSPEPVFENLPVYLNLADSRNSPLSAIGIASAVRDPKSGQTNIIITLDEKTSDKLANLAEVFDLKAIGFAGIKKREEKTTKQRGRQVHDAACAWVTRAETCNCHLAHTEREQDGG